MQQNNTSKSASVLGTPGDLIANIPGILGFFPTESVVFAAMFQERTTTRYTLGPVVRIDVDELHLLTDVGKALEAVDADLIFSFVITEKAASIEIEEIVEELFVTAESGIIDITACWITTGIYSGENYQLAFGPTPDEINSTCTGLSEWEHGRVSPVTQAAATRNMLEHGHLPEINRSDAYAAFDRGNRFLTPEGIGDLSAQAKAMGDDILQAIRNEPDGSAYDAALDEFSNIILRARTPRRRSSVNVLLQRPGLLRDTAAYLTSVLLRDSVLHHCASNPALAADLFMAVAKTFDGAVRSNALCLYALAVINLNLGMKAIPALDAALADNPGHSFSGLLRHGLIEGQFDSMVNACLRGNEMVRKQYSSSPPGILECEEDPDPDGSEPSKSYGSGITSA